MELPAVEIRQIRPCSVCAFFVHISETQDGICTLNKGEKKGQSRPRWDSDDLIDLTTRTCWYNITLDEIEGTSDPWVQSIVNESLRFYNSAHSHREITAGRRNRSRRP
ncbi:MAG: hypothetical protein V1862_04240 [Methanobacteriota archaeon]